MNTMLTPRRTRPIAWLFLLASLLILPGCQDPVCRTMHACCAASKDLQGMGDACGDLAKDVRDPDTCRTIVETIQQMYVNHGKKAPPECSLDSADSAEH